jgi:hypothetical protein
MNSGFAIADHPTEMRCTDLQRGISPRNCSMVVACILARRNSGKADEVSTLTFFKVAFWTARYWDVQCVKRWGLLSAFLTADSSER